MKLRIKSMIWNIRKKKIQSEQQEEKGIQNNNNDNKNNDNNNERLRSLWHNFKHTNIPIIGVLEGDETGQETEKLFEKIMKENFPNLVQEIDT